MLLVADDEGGRAFLLDGRKRDGAVFQDAAERRVLRDGNQLPCIRLDVDRIEEDVARPELQATRQARSQKKTFRMDFQRRQRALLHFGNDDDAVGVAAKAAVGRTVFDDVAHDGRRGAAAVEIEGFLHAEFFHEDGEIFIAHADGPAGLAAVDGHHHDFVVVETDGRARMACLVRSAGREGQIAVFQQDEIAADTLLDRLSGFRNFHFENDFGTFFQIGEQRFGFISGGDENEFRQIVGFDFAGVEIAGDFRRPAAMGTQRGVGQTEAEAGGKLPLEVASEEEEAVRGRRAVDRLDDRLLAVEQKRRLRGERPDMRDAVRRDVEAGPCGAAFHKAAVADGRADGHAGSLGVRHVEEVAVRAADDLPFRPFEAVDRVPQILVAGQAVERHDDFQMAKCFFPFDMDEADLIRAGPCDAAVFDAWADFAADDVLRMDLAEGQNHEKREERTDESFRQHGFPFA